MRDVVDGLGEREIRASLEFAAQVLDLFTHVVRVEVEGAADKKVGGLPDIGTGVVQAQIEALLDEFDQAGGHQVVIIHGVGVVADRGWVAHDNEYVAYIECVRGQQVALNAQDVASAGGEVQGGLDPGFALNEVADRPRTHAHARHGAVGHIDHVRAGFGQHASPGQEFLGSQSARWIHLDGGDKFPLG